MKKLLAISIGLVAAGTLFAQQLHLNNQYFINKYSLSPAYAGHNNNIEGFVSYRSSWTGVSGSPETRMINVNAPIFTDMGLGGNVVIDNIGIFRLFSVKLAYAYHYKINDLMDARFGLGVGMLENSINLTDASTQGNLQDPVAMNNASVKKRVFDMNFGAIYRYENLNVGFVIPQIIESKVKGETESLYTLSRHYMVHAGYSYDFHRDWTVDPYALVRMTANSEFNYEVAAMVKYQKMVWAGLNYRAGTTMGFTIGGIPYYEWIAMSYSYEFGAGMLSNSSGTHEISIGFRIGNKKNNVTSIFKGGTGTSDTAPSYFSTD